MPQYTAGKSHVAENRRKYMDPYYTYEKLRDIAEEDIVRLLAHRAPGEEYKSIHPPLEEMEEPDCAVRQMVEPTEGAKAGDRIRCVQFTDSMFFAPITPYQRAWSAYNRYRGVDIGVSSGSTIIEARERDLEKIAKELIDSELYDTARTGLRGRTVDGHALRLDEKGLMFDALRRWTMDERTKEVIYEKDMMGDAMDKEVVLGKPLPEDELRKRTTMYRNAQGGVWQEADDPESMDVCAEIHWKRTVCGFQPWRKMSEIKGGKKDVGVKNLLLFDPNRISVLTIRLIDVFDKTVQNTKYRLEVGDEHFEGYTDESGILSHQIPSEAKTGKLELDFWSIDLKIEYLSPADMVAGSQARLDNLGYFASGGMEDSQESSEQLQLAMMQFQSKHNLEATGKMNESTKKKLEEIYGS